MWHIFVPLGPTNLPELCQPARTPRMHASGHAVQSEELNQRFLGSHAPWRCIRAAPEGQLRPRGSLELHRSTTHCTTRRLRSTVVRSSLVSGARAMLSIPSWTTVVEHSAPNQPLAPRQIRVQYVYGKAVVDWGELMPCVGS